MVRFEFNKKCKAIVWGIILNKLGAIIVKNRGRSIYLEYTFALRVGGWGCWGQYQESPVYGVYPSPWIVPPCLHFIKNKQTNEKQRVNTI